MGARPRHGNASLREGKGTKGKNKKRNTIRKVFLRASTKARRSVELQNLASRVSFCKHNYSGTLHDPETARKVRNENYGGGRGKCTEEIEREREERASRGKVSGAIIIFKKEKEGGEDFLSRAFCFSTLILYPPTVFRQLSKAQIFTGSH